MQVSLVAWVLLTLVLLSLATKYIIQPIFFSPLSRIPPAHPMSTFSNLWISYQRYIGYEVRSIHDAHRRLGPIVRLGRDEISVNDIDGVKVIYGFDKTIWYKRAFDNYGVPNMFSMLEKKPHSERRKVLGNVYNKSTLFSSLSLSIISQTVVVDRLLPILHSAATSTRPINIEEIFLAFSIDFVTAYLFGTAAGTNFLENEDQRENWLSQNNRGKEGSFWDTEYPGVKAFLEGLGYQLVPKEVQKARSEVKQICFQLLEKMKTLKVSDSMAPQGRKSGKSGKPKSPRDVDEVTDRTSEPIIYDQLAASFHRVSTQKISLSGLQDNHLLIASELMDHIKAGTETTGWTLTYVVYELSRRPGLQRTLQEELKRIDMPFYSPETKYLDEEALTTVSPSPQALDALPLLSAVIHETLRRYPAVPGPQPRITPTNSLTTVPTNLGNSVIPGGIRVSAQAYSLHRNESVFPAPEEWHPWRWIDANEDQKAQMNKWLWAFGSGSRMCIGKDFALMELKLVISAIYTNYTTSIIDAEGIEMRDGYSAGPKGDKLIVQLSLA